MSGRVVDSTGAPVPSAAVALRSRGDSALVGGAVGAADGTFRVRGLRPGAYVVRITRIGYRPRVLPLTITASEQRVDLARIVLTRLSTMLDSVNVTSEATVLGVEADRTSFRVKDVAPAAANAGEVLEAVPSVQVDPDGKVSLRGNENVVVQINGRPSPLRGLQLAAFLRGLSGAIVERVEVVQNPSAKYDPEGMAGIINIVLKQETDLGASGGATVSAMSAERWNGAANAGWQRGRMSLAGSYGYQTDERGIQGLNERESFNEQRILLSSTQQDMGGTTRFSGHSATGQVDFRLSPRDLLSQSVVLSRRAAVERTDLAFSEHDAAGVLQDQFWRPRVTRSTGWLAEWASSWKRSFTRQRHELSAELRLTGGRDEDSTYLATRSPDQQQLLEAETQASFAHTAQLTAQLDYTRPLGTSRKAEAGWRSSSRWLGRDFDSRWDSTGAGAFLPTSESNRLSFDEHVQAMYLLVSQEVRKLDLQAGLRAEYTARDFRLSGGRYPYDYLSFFPSAAVGFKATGTTQLRLAYSRRIRRPGIAELNPFPQFFDTQNQIRGDPALRPEFTDAFDLSVSRSGRAGTVQLAPFFRHTSDIIRVAIEPDVTVNGRQVTTVSFVNLATSNSFGADVTGQTRIGRRISALGSANLFRLVTDGGSLSALGSTAIGWSTSLNATLTLPRDLSVQALYFYRAPFDLERGRWGALQTATVAVRQRVLGGRGTVTLRMLDPFDTNRFTVTAGTPTLQQLTTRRPGVRGAFLGFQYATGQAPRLRAPRQEPPPPQAPSGLPSP